MQKTQEPRFCGHCGQSGTLSPVPLADNEDSPMLERGEFIEEEGRYSMEIEVTVFVCSACKQESILL
jgi:hypothetical protein